MSRYGASNFTFSASGKVALACLILFTIVPPYFGWDFPSWFLTGRRAGTAGFIFLAITLPTMYLAVKHGKMQSGDAMTLGFWISTLVILVFSNAFRS